jgi:quinol monooxygenase YgiN
VNSLKNAAARGLRWVGIGLCAVLALTQTSNASAADEAIVIVAKFVAAGREAELEARPLKTAAFVRKAEPNYIYRFQRSVKDPAVFMFYEVYPSLAALEQHSNVTLPAPRKEFGVIAEGLLARPPEIERFQPLPE